MANRLDQLLRVTATGHSQCSSPVVLFQVTMSSTWVSSSVPGVAPIKSGANEAGSSVVGCSGGTILIDQSGMITSPRHGLTYQDSWRTSSARRPSHPGSRCPMCDVLRPPRERAPTSRTFHLRRAAPLRLTPSQRRGMLPSTTADEEKDPADILSQP